MYLQIRGKARKDAEADSLVRAQLFHMCLLLRGRWQRGSAEKGAAKPDDPNLTSRTHEKKGDRLPQLVL